MPHLIPLANIAHWQEINGLFTAESVDTECPHCHRRVTLVLRDCNHDQKRSTFAFTARCPGCGQSCHFWHISPNKVGIEAGSLHIYPNPRHPRKPITSTGDLPSPALERAYNSAITTFNAEIWTHRLHRAVRRWKASYISYLRTVKGLFSKGSKSWSARTRCCSRWFT